MRTQTIILAFTLIAATFGYAWASASLKSTMRSWKSDAATLDRMLDGSALFDEAEVGRIAHRLDDDARVLMARVSGMSGLAPGVKSQFGTFSVDIRSMIKSAGSRDEMKARYLRLRADCVACHNL
jgi:cytochrome c556